MTETVMFFGGPLHHEYRVVQHPWFDIEWAEHTAPLYSDTEDRPTVRIGRYNKIADGAMAWWGMTGALVRPVLVESREEGVIVEALSLALARIASEVIGRVNQEDLILVPPTLKVDIKPDIDPCTMTVAMSVACVAAPYEAHE